MDIGLYRGIDQKIDIRKEIAIKISKIIESDISLDRDLSIAIEKALAEEIYERAGEGKICPNCGSVVFGEFCKKCNQPMDEPNLSDQDSMQEDKEGNDLSDSEDADDSVSLESNQEKLPIETRKPDFQRRFRDFLNGLDIPEDHISLHMYLIMGSFLANKEIDAEISDNLFKKAAKFSGKSEKEIQAIWDSRPFNKEDVDELIEEWLAAKAQGGDVIDYGGRGATGYNKTGLEIRKVGNGYIPLIIDPYEDVVMSSEKKGKWLTVRGRELSARLVWKKKQERNDILYKILEAVIALRRDFLDAKNRNEALRIIENKPFEQQEVVKRHNLDKGTVSRHFSDKSVVTPHGVFMLNDLSRVKSLEQEDKTVTATQEMVRSVFEHGDSQGNFYSDREVAEMITEEGVYISERYVNKIRGQLNIPKKGERKRKVLGRLVASIMKDGGKSGTSYSNNEIADLVKKQGIEVSPRDIRGVREV